MKKETVREVIVCEGRYDRNALSQVVNATILETGGFQVFSRGETLALIRRLAAERGVILLLDSDGAGFVIRNYLRGALPKEQVKQAYIPDIPGKERRKRAPGKEGKLGVEGMEPAVLLRALRQAGATFLDGEPVPEKEPVTRADLLDMGLIGPGSAAKRAALLRRMELPEHMSTAALLEALHILTDREAFLHDGTPGD